MSDEHVKLTVKVNDPEEIGVSTEGPWATPTDALGVFEIANICLFVPLAVGDKVRAFPVDEPNPNDPSGVWTRMTVIEVVEFAQVYVYGCFPADGSLVTPQEVAALIRAQIPDAKLEGGFGSIMFQTATPVTDEWFELNQLQFSLLRDPEIAAELFDTVVDTSLEAGFRTASKDAAVNAVRKALTDVETAKRRFLDES